MDSVGLAYEKEMNGAIYIPNGVATIFPTPSYNLSRRFLHEVPVQRVRV